MTIKEIEKGIDELDIRIMALEEQIASYKAIKNSMEALLEQTINKEKNN